MGTQSTFYAFFFLSDKHLQVDHKPRCLRQMNNELLHVQHVHYKSTRFVSGLKQGSFYDLLVTRLYSCCPHKDQCFKKIINSLTHQGKMVLEKPFCHTKKSCSVFQYFWPIRLNMSSIISHKIGFDVQT